MTRDWELMSPLISVSRPNRDKHIVNRAFLLLAFRLASNTFAPNRFGNIGNYRHSILRVMCRNGALIVACHRMI